MDERMDDPRWQAGYAAGFHDGKLDQAQALQDWLRLYDAAQDAKQRVALASCEQDQPQEAETGKQTGKPESKPENSGRKPESQASQGTREIETKVNTRAERDIREAVRQTAVSSAAEQAGQAQTTQWAGSRAEAEEQAGI